MAIGLTPRQEKANKNRQALVDTAMQLFFEYGVDEVTIDEICKRCNVTKGVFYYNYPSKDHVVTLTINAKLDEYVRNHFVRTESAPLRQQLADLLLCSTAYFRSIGKTLTRKSYEAQVRSCIEVRIEGRSFVDHLDALVKRGMEQNAFRTRLSHFETYMMIIGTYTGMLMKWCTQSDALDSTLVWEVMIQQQAALMLMD